MIPTLKIEKMFEDVKTPIKMNATDSGYDVFAYSFKRYYDTTFKCYKGDDNEYLNEFDIYEEMTEEFYDFKSWYIHPFSRILIGTGLKCTVAPEYEIQVRPRSGFALKCGITVLNSPGTIDESFSKELGVILINLSGTRCEINLGDRIAQIVACPVCLSTIEIVDKLPETNRGGFGSSGK